MPEKRDPKVAFYTWLARVLDPAMARQCDEIIAKMKAEHEAKQDKDLAS